MKQTSTSKTQTTNEAQKVAILGMIDSHGSSIEDNLSEEAF